MTPGCYPAAVTPMRPGGEMDAPGMARLLAWFESQGCAGAVLAGTNGEGPSLSAVEKRDLLREMMPVRGRLELILGVATSSLTEAIWSCKQAAKAGARAALVMPPSYFREAPEAGIRSWFRALLDECDLPLLAYNFPKRTGVEIGADLLASLADHANFAGAKDSSGCEDNLAAYRSAIPDKALFLGDETLLLKALEAGWTGTISGAANVLPLWLSQVVALHGRGRDDEARLKFETALPAIRSLRACAQPATNKAILASRGVIDFPAVRFPLLAADAADLPELFVDLSF